MSLRLYFDHHMKLPIAMGLRERGIDVLLASEVGNARLAEELLRERSSALGRVMVSVDKGFLANTTCWLNAGKHVAGVTRAPKRLSISHEIDDLEVIAGVMEPEEFIDRVEHLPLR